MSIWIDKYRPIKLEEVSGHVDIMEVFQHYVKTKKVPNIIIHGEPGSGKTSSILAMARELYGEEHFKTEVHELNADFNLERFHSGKIIDEKGVGPKPWIG